MDEYKKIIEAIDQGYIEGIHRQGNRSLTNKYIHKTFTMFLKKEGEVIIMGIDEWMDSIEKRKKNNPDAPKRNVKYNLKNIQVHESFATVLLDLFYDDKWYATDLFSLYKLNGDWTIVAKVYHM